MADTNINHENPIWVSTAVAAKALNLGKTTLKELQRSERIKPGVHWAYLTGRRNGPVGWSIPAMAAWQCAATKKVVEDQKKVHQQRLEQIETYDSLDLK